MSDNKEVLARLINMTGYLNGDVVFLAMKSKAKGLMTTEKVEYTPKELETLMLIAKEQGLRIRFEPYTGDKKISKEELRVGIRMGMNFDEYVYTLAHELAHYFLHYDKGDTIASEKHADYEEQADRAAKMLLTALSIV